MVGESANDFGVELLFNLVFAMSQCLDTSQCFSAHLSASHSPVPELSAVFPSSQRFLEFPELPRAQKIVKSADLGL